MVAELARANGLRVAPGIAQRVALAANNNQAIAASELEKFSLYLGASPDSPRDLDADTMDLLSADSAEGDMLRLGDLALGGRMDALLDELGRLPMGGSEAVPVLRALQRRLLMLSRAPQEAALGETLVALARAAARR